MQESIQRRRRLGLEAGHTTKIEVANLKKKT